MAKDNQISFTNALKRLEEIVEKLEDPSLDLEVGLKLLEEGVSLHKFCKNKLTDASAKIATILKDQTASKESEVI